MTRASLFKGHGGAVWSVCVAEERVYTANRDGTAKCFDVATGEELITFSGHGDAVRSVCVAGGQVYTASWDGTAKSFDAATGEELVTFSGHGDVVNSVCVADGRVYTASRATAKCFHAATGKELVTFRGHSGTVWSVCVDGGRVYTASDDETAKCFDAATERELVTFRGDGGAVFSVCVDDGRVYTANRDGTAKCFDAATGEQLVTFRGHSGSVRSVCVADGRAYTASYDKTVKCFDTATGEELVTFRGHGGAVWSVSVAEGRIYTAGRDETVKCFDTVTGKELVTFRGHGSPVTSVCFADGRAYTASEDKTAKCFDVTTGEEFVIFRGHSSNVNSVCVAHGRVYTASNDKTARCFDAATGEKVVTFSGHSGWVNSVCVADGRVYTASDDKTARCFNAATGEKLVTFRGHGGAVRSVCVAGWQVYTASDDMTVKCFDAVTGKDLVTFRHDDRVNSVCVADGRVYTAGKAGTAKCFDAATGVELVTFSGHSRPINSVCVADGRVFTGSDDKTARCFNAATGEEIVTHHFQSRVMSVYYTCGNLAVGLVSGTAHLCPHADVPFAPSWKLRLAANIDRADPDPNKRYSEALNLLNANPGATYTNQAFFNSLCEDGEAAGLAKCLFDRNLPVAALSYTELLKAAFESSSRDCIRLVLGNLAKSIANHNAVYDHNAFRNHQLTNFESDTEFLPLLLCVLKEFPDLVVDFFKNAPLLRTPTVVNGDFDGMATLGRTGFRPFPSNSFIEVGYWEEKRVELSKNATLRVETEQVQTPFPGFFKPGPEGFLFELLRVADPEIFGTITVHLVTTFKWDSFAKRRFYIDLALYVVSLVAMVASTILYPNIPFGDRYSETFGLAVACLLGVASLEKLYEVGSEMLVCVHGVPGGAASYFSDTMNLIRLVQMTLCLIFSAFYNTESSIDGFVVLLGMSAFMQWLGLFYYFQLMPQMRQLVWMVKAITYDIRSILLLMMVALLSLANLSLVLVQYLWESEHGGFEDSMHGGYENSTHDGYEDSRYNGYEHSMHDGYEDSTNPFFSTYKILILAGVPEIIDKIEPTVLWRLVFMVTSVTTSLVLLNLLIARINNTYGRIQDVAEMEEWRMKAKLVTRYELGMPERSFPHYFPKFVKALVRKGENRGINKKSQLAGVLSEMKENIVKNKREMIAQIEKAVMTKVEENKKEVMEKVEENKKEVMAKVEEVMVKAEGIKKEVVAKVEENKKEVKEVMAKTEEVVSKVTNLENKVNEVFNILTKKNEGSGEGKREQEIYTNIGQWSESLNTSSQQKDSLHLN